MTTALSYLLLAFFISMLWAPLLIHWLYKLGIVRKVEQDFASIVGERYLKAGTPIMGGLLVVVTTIILTILFNWNSSTVIPIFVFLISALLGGLDDILNIRGKKRIVRTVEKQKKLAKVHKDLHMRIWYWVTLPWTAYLNLWYAVGSYPGNGIQAGEKIIIQIGSGALVAWWIYFGLGWDTIWIPLLGDLSLGWLMPVFIIFTVISMTNAVNISDGMDGLSTGLMLPAFSAYLYFAIVDGNHSYTILIATIIGSLLAYLYFNIKPARIEMGDVGTLALGAILAALAFALDRVFLLPIIGFMFVLEIGSSLVQSFYRKLYGRRLLKMAPLHLHFQIKGWSEEKVVMRFWLFAIMFAIAGVWIDALFR